MYTGIGDLNLCGWDSNPWIFKNALSEKKKEKKDYDWLYNLGFEPLKLCSLFKISFLFIACFYFCNIITNFI